MTLQQMIAMCSGLWLGYTAGGAILLTSASLMVTSSRSLWLLARAADRVSSLERVDPSPRLRALAAELGIRRLVCVAGTHPAAFCAGAMWPSVFISEGLVDGLDNSELEAVLLHELDHSRQREPLRRALRQAVAWGFFYVPLLRWWADGQAERSELRADRLALAHVGPQVLARALLLADGGGPSPRMVTAFAGAAEARVAQLLGETLPSCRAGHRLWMTSAAGVSIALWGAHCIGGLLAVR
ncbi:MAG: M56 family metallopeptidase [Candidatus Dormibacteria bacterium]